MKNKSPKYIARQTRKKFKSLSFQNYDDLCRVIESYQFTVIEYRKHTNSPSVSALIEKLHIENEIREHNSFIYINNALRFVFINADVCEEDKYALLRHELGHICDPDFMSGNVIHSAIKKEEFANAFSFYLQNPGISFSLYLYLSKKWKLLISVVFLIAAITVLLFALRGGNFFRNESVSTNASISAYYVTSAGKKFHLQHCIVIKYKNNLTRIDPLDAYKKGYKPCLICNPDGI